MMVVGGFRSKNQATPLHKCSRYLNEVYKNIFIIIKLKFEINKTN